MTSDLEYRFSNIVRWCAVLVVTGMITGMTNRLVAQTADEPPAAAPKLSDNFRDTSTSAVMAVVRPIGLALDTTNIVTRTAVVGNAKNGAEGAGIGFLIGAIAAGIYTMAADDGGNLGLNLLVFSVPATLIGGIIGWATDW